MWLTLLYAGMAVHLAALVLLFLAGAPAVRAARAPRRDAPAAPDPQPRAAMIVPLTGDTPALRQGIASLLAQRGVAYEVWFVVRDKEDPAVRAVNEVIAGRDHAHLVEAGAATACCQKNHSLLAGIRAAGEDVDILVFCDSGHLAGPDFLLRLLEPVFQGRGPLSTTHRRILPEDAGLPTLTQYFAALFVQMLQNLPWLTQPWGGATAIRREVFLAHGVDQAWARGIADDVILGACLLRKGVRAMAVPEAALLTPLSGQTWRGLRGWWFRQLVNLKFCMPWTWVAATLPPLLLGAVMAGAAWLALSGPLTGSLTQAGLAWGYLVLLALLGPLYGSLSERGPALWRWATAFGAVQVLTVACWLRTWTTNTLVWRGLRYRVRLDGSVAEITQTDREI